MTKLKTNFEIRTTDENFRVHVETLKALGYCFYSKILSSGGMEHWTALISSTEHRDGAIIRGIYAGHWSSGYTVFENIQDFLVWHFTPEVPKKTEAEILLDSLEEEMQQLQTKIAALREQMLKEIKEKK